MDRRIRRTQQMLRQTLITLLQERRYDEITVQQISERANLGRATFYLHYQDKEDLVTTIILQDIGSMMAKLNDGALSLSTLLKNIFEHVAENKPLFTAAIDSRSSNLLRHTLQMKLIDYISQELVQTSFKVTLSAEQIELLAYHISGSALSLVEWWFTKHKDYSAEKVAGLFHSTILIPILMHFGWNDEAN